MSSKTVLLDLENNMPTAKMLRDITEHYSVLYLFNCAGSFEFSLEDLTEFSGWVSSGQIVILETPLASQKEFEYAVVTGQLMALLEPGTHIEVISAMQSIDILIDLLRGAELSCSLLQIQPEDSDHAETSSLPGIQTIREKPYLHMVKKYCDALGKMSGKPNTVEKLKNSIVNILQVVPEKAQHLVGMLINLKIVKRTDNVVGYRKKVLKQWTALDMNQTASDAVQSESATDSLPGNIDQIIEKLRADAGPAQQNSETSDSVESVQQALFKNFSKIDPVQLEVIRKLNGLKDKPKDIYELRDLLEQMFPQSDIRLLLKELIEKGYIYWNGHEVVYSHEMYLN